METPSESSSSPPEPPVVESLGGCTALPSASAPASALADVARVKLPPASTLTPVLIVASELLFARLIATAAATETPPSDVDADGVSSESAVPVPPLPSDVLSANPRSAETVSSTPLPLAPPDESPGAPAADAT